MDSICRELRFAMWSKRTGKSALTFTIKFHPYFNRNSKDTPPNFPFRLWNVVESCGDEVFLTGWGPRLFLCFVKGSRIGFTPSPGPSSWSIRGTPSPSFSLRRLTFGEIVDEPDTFTKVNATHPANIVESSSLASVAPPDTSYTLDFPEEIGLSLLQKETIKIACNQHERVLPDGSRAGFLIEDGTGFAAERDLQDIGAGKEIPVHALKYMKYGHRISGSANGRIKNGIFFSTYACLIAESHSRGEFQTRMDQILKWCHHDFYGVIVFDECHQAKNCVPICSGTAKKVTKGQDLICICNWSLGTTPPRVYGPIGTLG
ncbi:hypothetical protein DAPPUDRAFT_113924 [Daphnia pulex]|uniref:Strawberry notch AAA domain-containing protein n=1 Tax=Daphnia pulex TaxID=6669 RepID=E9HGI7_DAPPU|nr:hypothetical protein DAPPUDRAFT_113924 [Daphnia pulex]|eukprot:EFX69163.1 hypothetical protein DAPPUDRAFT_113924 [Daphnia pulex]